MKKLRLPAITSLAVGTLISAQVLAFDGRAERGIAWEDQLELSEQQEAQIEAIEDKYQTQFREMRQSAQEQGAKRQQAGMLMKQMRQEIQQVLTAEQKAQASNLIAERRQHALNQRLKKVARRLQMTADQQQQLRQVMDEQQAGYLWPVDREQRSQAREQFDSALEQILTRDQRQQWQAMKTHQKKRWHHARELRRERQQQQHPQHQHQQHQPQRHETSPEVRHGGLRKGYNDW